jgi:hypothetical protein
MRFKTFFAPPDATLPRKPQEHQEHLNYPSNTLPSIAIMGYTDVDKLAINTIRLLAVS